MFLVCFRFLSFFFFFLLLSFSFLSFIPSNLFVLNRNCKTFNWCDWKKTIYFSIQKRFPLFSPLFSSFPLFSPFSPPFLWSNHQKKNKKKKKHKKKYKQKNTHRKSWKSGEKSLCTDLLSSTQISILVIYWYIFLFVCLLFVFLFLIFLFFIYFFIFRNDVCPISDHLQIKAKFRRGYNNNNNT